MKKFEIKERKSKCSGTWYPAIKSSISFTDSPNSSAVISPHAGFIYSGKTSLKVVSKVKKNRIWFFGTSHYEDIGNGLSIFPGDYHSSIGKAVFPNNLDDEQYNILKKYLSMEGHRTEEHSIENVLYALNHFNENPECFCGLVRIKKEDDFDRISDGISKVWNKDDSIIVSTDWNHFVSRHEIDELMEGVSVLLNKGKINELYSYCKQGKYEACGIDSLYLTSKILGKVNEKSKFEVMEVTNSSKVIPSDKCVGYIAAKN